MNIKNKLLKFFIIMTFGIAACSCGGGGGGGGGGNPIASGGIGGTGTGTVSGMGSIIINETREFEIDANTTITIDDQTTSESDIEIGSIAQFDINSDASPDMTTGTAVNIVINTLVKGTVTSTTPLQILSQDVIVTGDTVLEDIPGNAVANLNIGDSVEVHGVANDTNVIQASRLEFKPGGILEWKLTGRISNLVANTSFSIGDQSVLFNGVVPRDCIGGIANGDLVEVKASQDPAFITGNSLTTVTDIECQVDGLPTPNNPVSNAIPAVHEEFVSTIISATEFQAGRQTVVTTGNTIFIDGTLDDLFVGAKLEVEGSLDTTTGILTANKIKFKETRVRIEAPVSSSQVTAGVSLEIMGITAVATAMTEDEDNIISSGVADIQVEVRGFIDSSGTIFANRIRERGAPDINDVRLRGPVDNIVPSTFEILGVTIDTATATGIFNATGAAINSNQFFNSVNIGSNVQVEDGTFDGVSRIDNGRIEIED